MENNYININLDQSSFDDLISGINDSGLNNHMRLINSKNNNFLLGQKYLMVTRTDVGLVNLMDVDCDDDNKLILALKDDTSGTIKQISINVDDNTFHFILIPWKDIKEMLMVDNDLNSNQKEFIEFDF
jgi:hypothetical protein